MPDSTSFPSGHSASAFAFATAISRERPWVALGAGFLAAAVAYSRVHTGVHYPGDTVIGSLIGASTGLAVAGLLDHRLPRGGSLLRPAVAREPPAPPPGPGPASLAAGRSADAWPNPPYRVMAVPDAAATIDITSAAPSSKSPGAWRSDRPGGTGSGSAPHQGDADHAIARARDRP